MSLKVCFLIDTMQPGGAERVVSTLCNYFANTEYETHLLLISLNKKESFYNLDENVFLSLLSEKKVNSRLKKISLIRKYLIKNKIDVAISFLPQINIYTYLATVFTNIKHIVSLRSDPNRDIKNAFKRFLRNKAFLAADKCVFQTEDAMNCFPKCKNHSVVIFNPVEKKDYYYKDSYHLKEIVSVGSFVLSKNKNLLFQAFSMFLASHPDFKLILYGDGPLLMEAIEKTKELGIFNNVDFMGHDKGWLEKSINSYMFVLSSDYEGMPNALMEALSVGIPCISTDCPIGGPKALIRNGENGFLVPTNDSDSLYLSMCKIADDNQYSILFAKNNQNFVNQYSTEVIGKKWKNLIKELLVVKK